MSGGHFDYRQYILDEIVGSIQFTIDDNNTNDVFGEGHNFPEDIITEFEKGIKAIKKARIYVQRIDWLLSGDDGCDSFHERLNKELEELKGE